MKHWKYSVRYQLYPLSEVYLNRNNYENHFFRLGNPTHIYVLSMVALMILLVGIFNFINIYSVVILKRGREWGMKKVFGAGSLMMFVQLYLENVLMMAFAILLGWVFIEVASPLVQNQMELTFVTNSTFDLLLNSGILFLLPLFTTLMPFIRYRREAPIVSLRSVNRNGGSVVSRQAVLGGPIHHHHHADCLLALLYQAIEVHAGCRPWIPYQRCHCLPILSTKTN